MNFRPLGSLCLLASLSLSNPLFAQQANSPEKLLPADLIDDPHVREELGVNEFTAPSIRLIFDDLEQLAPLPVKETRKAKSTRMPLVRSDLALEIGVLIAEGFLAVQNNTFKDIEEVAKELSRFGKALGAGERVNRHAASLLDHAASNRAEKLRQELSATQRDALECASLAVDRNFTEERANQLFREDVADYYESVVGSLDPQVSEMPHMVKIQKICADLRDAMTLAADEEPTEAKVSKIRILSSELTALALSRGK
jgi:hypothetical protein